MDVTQTSPLSSLNDEPRQLPFRAEHSSAGSAEQQRLRQEAGAETQQEDFITQEEFDQRILQAYYAGRRAAKSGRTKKLPPSTTSTPTPSSPEEDEEATSVKRLVAERLDFLKSQKSKRGRKTNRSTDASSASSGFESGNLEPQPEASPSILEGNSAVLDDLITFSDDEEGTKSVGKSVSTEEETSSVQEKEESSLGAEEEFSVEESSEESVKEESNKSSEVLLIDLSEEDQSDVPEEPDVVWPCVIWRPPTLKPMAESTIRRRLEQVCHMFKKLSWLQREAQRKSLQPCKIALAKSIFMCAKSPTSSGISFQVSGENRNQTWTGERPEMMLHRLSNQFKKQKFEKLWSQLPKELHFKDSRFEDLIEQIDIENRNRECEVRGVNYLG